MAHLLLYGGTFDPIHHGHLITARAAREYLAADGVLLIPARLSPHKQGEPPDTTPQQRLRMIELAIAGEKDFAIDDRELTRATDPSYTIDTVSEIAAQRPRDSLTLLIGQDQLPKLHLWHHIQTLLTLTDIAILGRPSDQPLQSTLMALRQHIGTPAANRLTLLPTPLIEISATHIRQRVRQGFSLAYLVPAPVAAYIAEHNLYGYAHP